MKESELKEQEGKKIWEIMKQCYSPVCDGCFDEEKECFVCAANAVCDYMLQKIEEAKKETANKIFKKLKEANDAFKYEILSDEERKDITSDDFYYRIVLTSAFKELGFEVEE